MNEYINITLDNVDSEHLCCAIGDKKHKAGVELKRKWLKERIKEGHIFRKLNVQGKVFIEYAPLESAWVPVNGNNFMYVYCLWVAGSFKGNGYAGELLNYAVKDAKNKGRNGICVISSKKKKPFFSEKSFFEHYGFTVTDSAGEYDLLSLSFNEEKAVFSDSAKIMEINSKNFTVYYSPECPYTLNCVGEIKEYADDNGIEVNFIEVDSLEKAKNMPCIFNNWANFNDGKFVSNTLLNKNSFEKLLK